MNNVKRYVTITLIVLGLIIGAGYGVAYYLSFKKVGITIDKPNITADIYQGATDSESGPTGVKTVTIHGSTTLSLQPGAYTVVIINSKNIAPTYLTFTVAGKDMSVDVNPSYSTEYLASLLPSRQAAINSTLMAKYPQLSNFTINKGALYDDGTWYGTTLIQSAQAGNNGDVYRTILHFVNNTWTIVAAPALVLSTSDNKSVPLTILQDLDSQTGYEDQTLPETQTPVNINGG